MERDVRLVTACTALLGDLRERGIRTDRTVLAVLDGSKALAKSVREVFGPHVLLQRCQAHKARNVLDRLPEDLRPSVREALRAVRRAVAFATRAWTAVRRTRPTGAARDR